MKYLLFVLAILSFFTSCTIVKVTNSYNTITISCSERVEMRATNGEEEILFQGTMCDWDKFQSSGYKPEALSNYLVKTNYKLGQVIYTHPNW